MQTRARRHLLEKMYAAALTSADPQVVLPQHLPLPPHPESGGRTVVIGAGKAAYAMAAALEAHWPTVLSGVVVAPVVPEAPLKHIKVLKGTHPIPDQASLAAAQALLAAVAGLKAQDLVIALISGGGSALMALPAPGVRFEEKQAITKALMRSGATIHELNVVRKHLSAVKGGKLARAAFPARVVTLVLSDIPGDELDLVASGPTVPDASTCQDALSILDRHQVHLSSDLRELLQSGALETPKPGDTCFSLGATHMIACAQNGLEAAAQVARQAGVTPVILSDRIEGESRQVATVMAAIAQQVMRHAQPVQAPCVLLSGGETTVTVKGQGRGGRNTEFALAAAMALQGLAGVSVMSMGTDGIDGHCDAAGAIVDEHSLAQMAQLDLKPAEYLDQNDSYTVLSAIGACVHTGPTGTNINDIRALLILPPS